MVYIVYAEDAGYCLMNEFGTPVSARWFSDIDTAEEYCYKNGYDFVYGEE